MAIIYEVFVEMSLACQEPQQVQHISGVLCPSMSWVGGWVGGIFPPTSSHLSPPLLPVDINKNRQLTTKQQGSSVEKEASYPVRGMGGL